MSMRSVISFGVLAAIAAYVEAWPNGYDEEFDAWRLARRSFVSVKLILIRDKIDTHGEEL